MNAWPNNLTSATNSASAGECTLESIRDAMKKGEALRRNMLRSMGEIAEIECHVCHRKMTTRSGPFGYTIVVCRHLYDQIRLAVHTPGDVSAPIPLYSIAIEVLDDGPRRW